MEKTTYFRPIPLGKVRPTGWILNQMRRDLEEGFAGHLDELTNHAANDIFKNRIGTSTDHYAWWDSETRGNWLWGYTMMAYLANHETHKARAAQLIAGLKATQDPDGYIGIYLPQARYRHAIGENGELWGQSRALLALLAYYELTGDESYLSAIRRVVDLTMQHYGEHNSYFHPKPDDMGNSGLLHGLNYIDALERLYAITGETKYRDFAVWLYEDFNRPPFRFPNDDIKLQNLLKDKTAFAGHSAHTAEHIRLLIFAYFMTDNPEMGKAAQVALSRLQHYSTASGALIGDESIHGLPWPDMGYEYCTMTEQLWSLFSALEKFGDARFGDLIENLAFNAAQGARFANGTSISYLSTENRFQALTSRPDTYTYWHTTGRYKFSPTHEDIAVCCNPNAVRFMPHYVSRMWMQLTGGEGIAAVGFGPSVLTTEIDGVTVVVHEETSYPFTEYITFRIEPQRPLQFRLLIRQAGWSTATRLEDAGASVTEENGFFVLDKVWSAGDTVTIQFTATIKAIENPVGEYHVQRGPLFYAMPIDHELHPIKDYALTEFHDYDITPKSLDDAYCTPILDAASDQLGLTFVSDPVSSDTNPWASAPLQLKAGNITLVPMGATVLRRATFPLRNAKR